MKKGFTLIELLAVIVILAIIALIATPIILGVVENARKSAAGSSALGYIDAVSKEIALGGFNETFYPTGEIDIKNESPYDEIEVQGSKPTKGTLYILDNYRIEAGILCVNDYRVDLLDYKVDSIKKGCEDMSAKFLVDYSGNGNHGYLQGATKNEDSVITDGVDDYVFAGLLNHEYKNEFNIVIRLKFNSLSNQQENIFGNWESGGSGIAKTQTTNKLFFNAYSPSKKSYVHIYSDEEIVIDKWYTIVGTLKDGKLHLYVNGNNVDKIVEFNEIIKSSLHSYLIGTDPHNCNAETKTCDISNSTNITFTDAIIFDRGLSDDEITKEFSNEINNISNTAEMVLRYDLDK